MLGDSMAYDTIQKPSNHINIGYEKEDYEAEGVEAGEHDLNPEAVQNSAISVLDESEKALEDGFNEQRPNDFSPMRST